MRLFTARAILPDPRTLWLGGGLLVDGGRVVATAEGLAECARLADEHGAELVDLGDGLLAPGTVNAHAHLDLTAFAGRVDGARGFGGWVRALLDVRAAASEGEIESGVVRGADRLLATGTTAVGDIDSTGRALQQLVDHPLRVRAYREVLDAGDDERTGAAIDVASRPYARTPRLCEGISPHAPFTVSPELFATLGALARTRSLAATIHWSETEDEVLWLTEGRGGLAQLLSRSPRMTGLDLIEGAGMLSPQTSLVHGNWPAQDEPERLARAGVALIHCPGTHAFFEREPFPLEHYRGAGTALALGTDSLASNEDLDMRREMALLRAACPGLAAQEVWSMATVGGARALAYGDRIGTLRVGSSADFCLYRVEAKDRAGSLEELTASRPDVEGVWIDGVRVVPSTDSGAAPAHGR